MTHDEDRREQKASHARPLVETSKVREDFAHKSPPYSVQRDEVIKKASLSPRRIQVVSPSMARTPHTRSTINIEQNQGTILHAVKVIQGTHSLDLEKVL